MRFVGTCYRAHDPKWSYSPTSGDGAALRGGRFNPIGVPALYLSLEPQSAIREISHGLSKRFDPCVLCAYDVDVDDVVDLRTLVGRRAAGTTLKAMAGPWLDELLAGKRPLSWSIYDQLHGGRTMFKRAGIIVPSFAIGTKKLDANLVLWNWGSLLPHRVEVFDPKGRLPKNQHSWV